MALSVSLALSNSNVIANAPAHVVATVTNTNSSSVTLVSLVASSSQTGVIFRQPQFLTPNVAPGVGNPVLAATTGSASYTFSFVASAPYSGGPSPQAPGGGWAPNDGAYPASGAIPITVTGQTSDGSVFSSVLMVAVLSAVAVSPIPEGGALQFTQGSNLVNLLMMAL